jgi:hypothetical protein
MTPLNDREHLGIRERMGPDAFPPQIVEQTGWPPEFKPRHANRESHLALSRSRSSRFGTFDSFNSFNIA